MPPGSPVPATFVFAAALEDRYGYGAAYPAEELPDAEPYETAGTVDDGRPDDIGGFDREGNLR